MAAMRDTALGDLLAKALATGDDTLLRAALVGRIGPADPTLVQAFAREVGAVIRRPDPPVAALERLLDGWAALTEQEAPDNRPEVVLPCAAVAAYGEAGVAREEWFPDEIAKLRRASADPRPQVRETVVQALHRLLDTHPSRTGAALRDWAAGDDPLVVEVAGRALRTITERQ